MGFLDCRRRACVALSRFRFQLILLMPDNLGDEYSFWGRLRRIAYALGCLIDVDATQQRSWPSVVEKVVEFIGLDLQITPQKIATACVPHQIFFKEYQFEKVGPLSGKFSLPGNPFEGYNRPTRGARTRG